LTLSDFIHACYILRPSYLANHCPQIQVQNVERCRHALGARSTFIPQEGTTGVMTSHFPHFPSLISWQHLNLTMVDFLPLLLDDDRPALLGDQRKHLSECLPTPSVAIRAQRIVFKYLSPATLHLSIIVPVHARRVWRVEV